MVAQDWAEMLPQHFHCGICTTDVFISYTPGILCFLQWLSIEIITKLSGDISHILNNYLEYSKSIKLGDFVKAFVVPDAWWLLCRKLSNYWDQCNLIGASQSLITCLNYMHPATYMCACSFIYIILNYHIINVKFWK